MGDVGGLVSGRGLCLLHLVPSIADGPETCFTICLLPWLLLVPGANGTVIMNSHKHCPHPGD